MAPPDELEPFHITRADFLYQIGDEATWRRLPSPVNDGRHNCWGIEFNSGMILTQKDPEYGSICHLKLILKPPILQSENELPIPIIEAECVEVQDPSFTAHCHHRGRAMAIEHAKTLPLASLDKAITAVKLRNLSARGIDGPLHYDDKLRDRIWQLIDRGYRAAQTISGEKKYRTILPRPASISPDLPPHSRTSSSLPPPPPSSRISLYLPPLSSTSSEMSTNKDTLRERLRAHQAATAEGEQQLRREMESETQALSRVINMAISHEWDRKEAAAVAEHRAQATSTVESILAEGDPQQLRERLQAHQAAVADDEQRLRHDLEDEMRALSKAVTVAVGDERENRVAAAVAEYRAQAASTVEKIVAGGNSGGARV